MLLQLLGAVWQGIILCALVLLVHFSRELLMAYWVFNENDQRVIQSKKQSRLRKASWAVFSMVVGIGLLLLFAPFIGSRAFEVLLANELAYSMAHVLTNALVYALAKTKAG